MERVPYPIEKPTANETTHATKPAPYPIMVDSSTTVFSACAANGAIAVAKAATAAVFLSTLNCGSGDALLMESAMAD